MDILYLLEEIETGKLNKRYGSNSTFVQLSHTELHNQMDKNTAKLCSILQTKDVTQYSLEMQMWWRDHQIADKKRIQEELEAEKTEAARKRAIAKLTPYERELLGL